MWQVMVGLDGAEEKDKRGRIGVACDEDCKVEKTKEDGGRVARESWMRNGEGWS